MVIVCGYRNKWSGKLPLWTGLKRLILSNQKPIEISGGGGGLD